MLQIYEQDLRDVNLLDGDLGAVEKIRHINLQYDGSTWDFGCFMFHYLHKFAHITDK